MCGIAGIVRLEPRERVDEARLRLMAAALAHRGPDGEGVLLDGPVGLAHRRLAIVDAAGGAQPMASHDGRRVIVFNGEIYNHPELKAQLEARGHRYRTRSDTETILHLHERQGESCVERLRGMFAFAIWERSRRRLLLARDRLGIKPLYYALDENELVFASEIKALLAAGVRPKLNAAALPEFLAAGYVAGEETLFAGIRALQPGRTLTFSYEAPPRERRYWRLDPPPAEPVGRREAARGVRKLLEQAVESHLMSDVPLGVLLSGGIDSSAIAALLARKASGPVLSFAVGFAEAEANELAYARIAAAAAGAEHRELLMGPEEFFAALPRLVWHEDEPIAFPSSIPLHFVSCLAARHVKVVLTGEGSDELFLGYNRYRVTAWNERLGRPYWSLVPERAQHALRGLLRGAQGPWRHAERSFLGLAPGTRSLFLENFAVFPERHRRALLPDPQPGRDPFAEALRRYEEAAGGCLERMSAADVDTYLVRLLGKQDRMGMAASIESRVPFLDHPLVERAAALPPGLRLRGFTTKSVLRDALADVVPRSILTRRKMGFPVPVGRWLRGRFSPLVREFVLGPRAAARRLFRREALDELVREHLAGEADHGTRLWLLINLEVWQRVFFEGEDAGAVMRAA